MEFYFILVYIFFHQTKSQPDLLTQLFGFFSPTGGCTIHCLRNLKNKAEKDVIRIPPPLLPSPSLPGLCRCGGFEFKPLSVRTCDDVCNTQPGSMKTCSNAVELSPSTFSIQPSSRFLTHDMAVRACQRERGKKGPTDRSGFVPVY